MHIGILHNLEDWASRFDNWFYSIPGTRPTHNALHRVTHWLSASTEHYLVKHHVGPTIMHALGLIGHYTPNILACFVIFVALLLAVRSFSAKRRWQGAAYLGIALMLAPLAASWIREQHALNHYYFADPISDVPVYAPTVDSHLVWWAVAVGCLVFALAIWQAYDSVSSDTHVMLTGTLVASIVSYLLYQLYVHSIPVGSTYNMGDGFKWLLAAAVFVLALFFAAILVREEIDELRAEHRRSRPPATMNEPHGAVVVVTAASSSSDD